jgi:GGDEF domain-containing protein
VQEKQRELDHLASHDSLTGLPNRRLFLDRLAQALARSRRSGEPLALLFIDLDHFKEINDRLGHGAGDIVLRAVAGRLVAEVREIDTVARLGGDEFIILLDATEDRAVIAKIATPAGRAGRSGRGCRRVRGYRRQHRHQLLSARWRQCDRDHRRRRQGHVPAPSTKGATLFALPPARVDWWPI